MERKLLDGTTMATNWLANAYVQAGWMEQGRKVIHETALYLRMFPEGGRHMASLYNNIASIYLFEGMHELAIRYYMKAVVSSERNAHQSMQTRTRLYNNVASAFTLLNEPVKAHYYLDMADSLARSIRDSTEMAHILLSRGEVYRVEGRYNLCEEKFMAARKIAEATGNEDLRYLSATALSTLYNKQNNPAKAIEILSGLIKPLSGQYATPYYYNALANELGTAYYQTGNYDKAIHYFNEALDIANQANMRQQRILLLRMLAESYAAEGKHSEAYRYLHAYHELYDSTAYADQAKHSNELEIKYRTARKDNELIKKQLLITRQAHDLERNNRNMLIAGTGILLLIATLISLMLKRRLQDRKITTLQQQQEITHLRALIEGEEKERTRLSRELHDGIGGMLAAINMHINALYKRHPGLFELPGLIKMVKTTTEEVRKTAHNLIPDVLIRHSLNDAIRQYCEQVSTGGGLHITLSFAGRLQLPKSAELILYRIVQELIQNIIKHAEATEAFVETAQSGDKITIVVEDNGKGFDTTVNEGGFGIQNLIFRIRALQGSVSVESAPGSGTTINILFDLTVLNAILDYEHQDSNSG